jgi:hypothetical protein
MFVDLPAELKSFARCGANPFQPSEIVERLRDVALHLQRRHEDSLQPAE